MVNRRASTPRLLKNSAAATQSGWQKKLSPTKCVTFILAMSIASACAGGRQALPSATDMSVFRSFSTGAAPSQPPGLVLSNTLASKYNVLHSQVGPNLEFCQGQDGCTRFPYGAANPAYVQGHGIHMHAITIGPGSYGNGEREINVILPEPGSVLNSDQGAISVWFKANAAPAPYLYGVYRIFAGAWGLNSSIQLYMDGSDRLYFTIGATEPSTQVTANSLKDRQPGVPMDKFIGQWIHILAVWNRAGIGTSGQTLQLSINSGKQGMATASGWTTDLGTAADIAGGNDSQIDGKFDEGQLQIYNTNP